MSKAIHYSDGSVVENPIIVIEDDLHEERSGFLRAFWTAGLDAPTMSPVVGYCSPGGSHRTVKAVVAEVSRLYPDAEVYRNGRKVRP